MDHEKYEDNTHKLVMLIRTEAQEYNSPSKIAHNTNSLADLYPLHYKMAYHYNLQPVFYLYQN